MAMMEQQGSFVAGTRTDVARVFIGVAVREGAAAPDISTAEAFRKTLLDARAIAFTDASVGGTAAVFLPGLFERMGIADEVKRKALPQKSGGAVAEKVAERRGRSRHHADPRIPADQGRQRDRQAAGGARRRHHLYRRGVGGLERARGGIRLHRRAGAAGRARGLAAAGFERAG